MMTWWLYRDEDTAEEVDRGTYMAWAEEMETLQGKGWRTVAKQRLWNGYLVSTVFLHGIDHCFGIGGPLLFETMVFGPPGSLVGEQDMRRYGTVREARAGHRSMVARWRKKGPSFRGWMSALRYCFSEKYARKQVMNQIRTSAKEMKKLKEKLEAAEGSEAG